jgi:hypothetical protein
VNRTLISSTLALGLVILASGVALAFSQRGVGGDQLEVAGALPLPSIVPGPPVASTPKPTPVALPPLPPAPDPRTLFDSLAGTPAEHGGPDKAGIPAPLFEKTGGPYITKEQALAQARGLAAGPITREEVRFLSYASIVQWTGVRTATIDLAREFYLVVLAAPYQPQHGGKEVPPCQSFSVLVDATYGMRFGLICGDGPWPSTLPAEFAKPA